MSARALITAFTLLAGLASGCGTPTEIFVVVDSEVGGLDTVTVLVTPPAGDLKSASGSIADRPFPRTVGVAHENGPLGPVLVHVQGSAGGSLVVERKARLDFIEGRVLVLPITLASACARVACTGDTTCLASGTCGSMDVDSSTLSDWDGTVPRSDGGVVSDASPPDARADTSPMCVPSTETCNGADDDCDGSVDEDFDLTADPSNCGSCGNRCRGGNSTCCTGVCQRGTCP